ncbi:MAG: LysR family transcriptional regulator [Firmicutes bacterium]|nr:LysR family transcriptional regulator [Bacillota bacterium]
MNLSKIQYFFKAVELENFTRAAQACHIAQTTMSKYIGELETELGVHLFHRGVKNVTLTDEGRIYYEGMKKINDQYTQLCENLQMAGRKEVRIGMITRDYAEFPILSQFEKQERQSSLYFSYGEEEKVMDDFSRGRLDGLICPDFMPVVVSNGEEVVRENLSISREVLIYSKELVEQYDSLENILCNLPLVTKTEDATYIQACRERLQTYFEATFDQVEVVKEYHQQILMVNMSKGFAIVPEHTYYDNRLLESLLLPDEFNEMTQIVYHKQSKNQMLHRLIAYIAAQ